MEELIKALKLCAQAHEMEPFISEEDNQFYVLACNIPTAADIQSIVTGFTGSKDAVEADFNHEWITVFLNECQILPKNEIDWVGIEMALTAVWNAIITGVLITMSPAMRRAHYLDFVQGVVSYFCLPYTGKLTPIPLKYYHSSESDVEPCSL